MGKKKKRNARRRGNRPPSSHILKHKLRAVDPEVKAQARAFVEGLPGYIENIHDRWMAHGANYLASDYSRGLWSPIFESLYEDGSVAPSKEEALDLIISRFWVANKGWVGVGQALGQWVIQEPEGMYLYYLSALRQVEEANPDCDPEVEVFLPHRTVVWSMFHRIQQQVLMSAARST